MAEKEQENNDAHVAKDDGKDELAEVRDRLLRLAAEFDNYKKRMAKDLENSREIGRSEVISKVLPTVDEFELAMKAFGKGSDNEKGIGLIFSNLMSTLKGFGLTEIRVDGKFDPYRHEIVLTRNDGKEDGEIIEVVRKGYMLNNIMLRPASVIVSKAEHEEEKQKGE